MNRCTDVAKFLAILHPVAGVFEIRALECPDRVGGSYRSTAAGYFFDPQVASKAITDLEKLQPFGIYVTMNPVVPALIARAKDRIAHKAKTLTGDDGIVCRRWLMLDLDPVRPSGVSSTDAEMKAALDLAEKIRNTLAAEGWPEPLLGMSGSGAYLLYRVDVPNDEAMKDLFHRVLIGLDVRFSTQAVHVDTATFNASRILKILGTTPRKGDDLQGVPNVEDRPHRQSWFFEPDSELMPVSIEQLNGVAVPKEEPKAKSAPNGQSRHNGNGRYPRIDADAVKQAARGNWADILVNVGGLDPSVLAKKGNACPKCTGGTRFDVLDIEVGAVICRMCFNKGNGDGISAIQWLRGWSFTAALAAIAKHLHMDVPESAARRNGFHTKGAHRHNGTSHFGDDMDRFEGNEPHINGKEVDHGEPSERTIPKKKRRIVPDPEAFPVDTLPSPMREYVVAASESLNCCESMIALPMLSAFAAAIGNTHALRLKGDWIAPSILWTCLVAESGSLKTPAMNYALKPFRTIDHKMEHEYEQKYGEYLEQYRRWNLDSKKNKDCGAEPEAPRHVSLIVQDVTYEAVIGEMRENPRGLLMERDELASFLGNMERYSNGSKAGGESSRWLPMYNAGDAKLTRKTGFPRRICISRANLSITGGCQPGLLRDLMDRTARVNGMFPRWLYSYPPPRSKQWTETEPVDFLTNMAVQNVVERLMFELELGRDRFDRPDPVVLELTHEARREFKSYFTDHNIDHAGLEGASATVSAKLEETPGRLALVFHMISWAGTNYDSDESAPVGMVQASTMRAAVRLAQWFKRQAEKILGTIAESDEDNANRKLAEWIRSKGGNVAARDLRDGLRAYRGDLDGAEAALKTLAKERYGTYEFPEGDRQRGRPTRIFILFDASPITTNTGSPEENAYPVTGDRERNSESEVPEPEWEYQPDEPYGEFR